MELQRACCGNGSSSNLGKLEEHILPQGSSWYSSSRIEWEEKVSIVRVGLSENDKFAEGYEAIFGKKKKETKKKKTASAKSEKKSTKKKKKS